MGSCRQFLAMLGFILWCIDATCKEWLAAFPYAVCTCRSECTVKEPCNAAICSECWVKHVLCLRYLLQPARGTAQIWQIRRKHSNQFAMKDIGQQPMKLTPVCAKKRSTRETQTHFWRLCLYTASSSAHPSPLLVPSHSGKLILAYCGGLGPTVRLPIDSSCLQT